MKTNVVLFTRILFLLAIVFFGCLVVDFMALHDIRNDYVSHQILTQYISVTSAALPEWTNAPSEWSAVEISFLIKLLVTGFFFFFLLALRKNIGKTIKQDS